jgi:hypothetical protein
MTQIFDRTGDVVQRRRFLNEFKRGNFELLISVKSSGLLISSFDDKNRNR